MNNQKLNYLEATFLVVIVTITHLVLNMPNTLIESTGSASIINIIYITILALVFFTFIKKLLSPFESHNILYVAEYVGGKALNIILASLYIVHFIFTSGILLRNFAEVLKIIYFPQAPTWSALAAFLLVALIVNKFGFKNVVKANAIIIIPILLTIVITAFSLLGKFEIHRTLPLIGYGFNETFIAGSTNIYAFSGIIYLFLVRPSLNSYKDFSKVGYTSLIISSLYLIFVVTALLMLFPYIPSGNQTLSVYLATRLVEYGKFMQRVDAVYMFVWIFDFMSYLSVIILFIKQVGSESFKIKRSDNYMYLVAFLIFIVAILPSNSTQMRFFETTIYKYASIGIVFVISTIILLLGYIKKRRKLKYEVT